MKKECYVPDYYPEFHCKADKCRNTCCSSWRIPVSRKEYNRLVTMECSDNLNRRIQNTFVMPEVVSEDCYRLISFNWLGECPIQEKGLCYLHREKGEAFLPEVCRLYPRSIKKINGFMIASCSSSCERVVEMLYENKGMNFVKAETEEEAKLVYQVDDEEAAQIRQFQEIIFSKEKSLARCIADVCRIINREEFEEDLNEEIDPFNETVKLLKRFGSNNRILSKICEIIDERYGTDRLLYDEDCLYFERRFPDWMYFFEGVIMNSMIYECFPFVDKRVDRTAIYRGLCACYGLMRLVCVSYTSVYHEKEDLIDAVSTLFHLIDHTAFYYNVSVIAGNAAVMLKM